MLRWARTAEKIRMDDERIFGITKLKLQAFSLAALEMILGDIVTKMATFRILVLVSKTMIRSREFSFSSQSLRMKIINLDLVSMLEIGGDFFSVSSRSLRLSVRNSRSRLDVRD